MRTPVLFDFLLRAIVRVINLLNNFFTATYHTGGIASNELVIQPSVGFSEVGVHILSGKDDHKISIHIPYHSPTAPPFEG
jgi:hypothetical protein